MRRRFILPLVTALAVTTSPALAATTSLQFGDNDCFGLGGACPGVRTAPTVLPQDNSTALDPLSTDVFGEIGTASFSAAIDLTGTTVTSATFTATVWGLDLKADSPANGGIFGDAFEGARFQVNGTDVGTYFSAATPDGNGPNRIETVMFDVAADLILNGTNTLTVIPEQDFLQFAAPGFSGQDAYAIDFVSLTFETEATPPPPPPVPLPAGLPLLLGALGLLGYARHTKT